MASLTAEERLLTKCISLLKGQCLTNDAEISDKISILTRAYQASNRACRDIYLPHEEPTHGAAAANLPPTATDHMTSTLYWRSFDSVVAFVQRYNTCQLISIN